MRNPDGSFACDRCGTDVGGGGVDRCAVVSDLDPDRPGMVRNLHFCRDRPDPDDPAETVKGCARKLVVPSMLAHYNARQEPDRG